MIIHQRLTGRTQHRVQKRLFGAPFLVVQVEVRVLWLVPGMALHQAEDTEVWMDAKPQEIAQLDAAREAIAAEPKQRGPRRGLGTFGTHYVEMAVRRSRR